MKNIPLILLTALILAGFNHPAFTQKLATLKAEAQLSSEAGRSIIRARDHHLVIDAPPPLGGPNKAINPIEVLLSALASCAVLVSERVAHEMDYTLIQASASVEGDLDPRGVKGEDVNPRLQAFRVELKLAGPTEKQAEHLKIAIQKRCPVYTTLERAAPIDLEVEIK